MKTTGVVHILGTRTNRAVRLAARLGLPTYLGVITVGPTPRPDALTLRPSRAGIALHPSGVVEAPESVWPALARLALMDRLDLLVPCLRAAAS